MIVSVISEYALNAMFISIITVRHSPMWRVRKFVGCKLMWDDTATIALRNVHTKMNKKKQNESNEHLQMKCNNKLNKSALIPMGRTIVPFLIPLTCKFSLDFTNARWKIMHIFWGFSSINSGKNSRLFPCQNHSIVCGCLHTVPFSFAQPTRF